MSAAPRDGAVRGAGAVCRRGAVLAAPSARCGAALPVPGRRRSRDVGLGERGGGGWSPRRALLAGRVPVRQHQRGGAAGGGERPRQGRVVSLRGDAD